MLFTAFKFSLNTSPWSLFSKITSSLPLTAWIICLLLCAASNSQARAADIKDANVAMQEKNYPRVIEILDTFLTEHPDDPRALLMRGRAHIELYAPDKALADLNRAIEIKPTKNGRDLLLRGRAYIALNDLDKALADLNKAIELVPDDAERYYYRGNAYSHKLDHETAFIDFHKAIELDPKYTLAYIARGYTQLNRGLKYNTITYKQGEHVYQAYQFDSVSNRDLVDQGLADLGRALEQEPENIYAYQVRVSLYRTLQEWPQYVADMKQLIHLSPDDHHAINELAWFLATIADNSLRDGKTAIELAEKACNLTNHADPAKLDTLAAAYAENKQFKKAIETQEKGIAKLGDVAPDCKTAFEKRLEMYRQKTPLKLEAPWSCDLHSSTNAASEQPLGPKKRKREAELNDNEQALLKAINICRKQQNLKPLTINLALVPVCREHTRLMVDSSEVTDTFNGKSLGEKINETGVKPGQWGINIGRAANTKDLVEEWKNSPIANANILNTSVNQIGISTLNDGNGNIYSTVTYVEIK